MTCQITKAYANCECASVQSDQAAALAKRLYSVHAPHQMYSKGSDCADAQADLDLRLSHIF